LRHAVGPLHLSRPLSVRSEWHGHGVVLYINTGPLRAACLLILHDGRLLEPESRLTDCIDITSPIATSTQTPTATAAFLLLLAGAELVTPAGWTGPPHAVPFQ
jgi:hypothetical protein